MASSTSQQGGHTRQLTGQSRPSPAAPAQRDPSTESSASSSGAWHTSNHSTSSIATNISAMNTAPSTTASTALTSPSSSAPVSPFSSPQPLMPAILDAEVLASAEEGHSLAVNGVGAAHGRGHYAKLSDMTEDDARISRKLAAQQQANAQGPHVNGNGSQGGDEWRELVSLAKQAGRAWRKAWEKDGWNGVTDKLRRTRVPSFSSARRALTTSPRFAPARALFGFVPPRRRALAAVTVGLILLFLLVSPSDTAAPISPTSRLKTRRGYTAHAAYSVLTSTTLSSALRPATFPKSQNKAKVLESVSNPYGFISLIDPYAGGVFNPSVLVLPDQVGLGWRHLLVARGEEKYEVIQGEDTRWEKIVGCFLLPLKRAHLELPYLARESELTTLNLPAQRKVPYQRCAEKVYEQFVGPEDPRLFLTDDGQPLLIYSQTGRSPNVCRALFLIDARMVIPGLDKALKKAGWNAPVQFREQTDLIRENQLGIEKNWSPFQGQNDELLFHVSLVPQQIYKYVPNLTLRPLDPLAPSHNCLTELLGPDMNRVHLHHATPLLRATLCKRGECKPDVHNTVLFAIIHVKYHPLPYLHYVRHVVTWNVTEPYNYLSVSRPLTYSGTNQADPIFTVSMAWDHPTQRHGLGLNHGFLDDTVLISFGVADYGSGYTDVLALDLLTDHQLCAGVSGTSLWQH
ncbi:hypothetical protein JCM3770_007316 [Rhodotorula araucariae]